jgi:hypothetical protein
MGGPPAYAWHVQVRVRSSSVRPRSRQSDGYPDSFTRQRLDLCGRSTITDVVPKDACKPDPTLYSPHSECAFDDGELVAVLIGTEMDPYCT